MQSLPSWNLPSSDRKAQETGLRNVQIRRQSPAVIFLPGKLRLIVMGGLKKNGCERRGKVHKIKKGKCYFRLILDDSLACYHTVSLDKGFIYVSFGLIFFWSLGLMFKL